MKKVKTTCFRDCWDACGMIATVEEGRVTRLEGDPDHPYTRGILCSRMKDFHKMNYSSERMLRPRLKREGRWQDISWDEALDICAENIRADIAAAGPLSILLYMGAGTFGVSRMAARRFFNLLGGATGTSGSLCDSAGEEGQIADFGSQWVHDPLDHMNSKLILLWGRNPHHSNIHLVPIIKDARERGASLAVIDPIRTEAANQADLHLQPRPGTDIYLALALGNLLIREGLADKGFISARTGGFEHYARLVSEWTAERAAAVCDVPVADIRRLARLYGETRPAAIIAGMGVQYYRHGAETMRAIDALGALTGNIGCAGGGVSFDFPSSTSLETKSWLAFDRVTASRSFSKPRLAEDIFNAQRSDAPVRSAWFIAANPVTQSPDSASVLKAFASIPFKVTVTPFDSDTARASDLVLPACTFLEKEDVRGSYWQPWVGYMNKAVEPLGESLSESEIFLRLAERMGSGDEMRGDWLAAAMSRLDDAGVDTVSLRKEGGMRSPLAPVIPYARGVFDNPGGKYRFLDAMPGMPEEADNDRGGAVEYVLLTPKAKRWHNSNLWRADHPTLPTAYVNPGTGEPNEMVVCLESSTGRLRCLLRHKEEVRPGVIMIYQGSNLDLGGGVNLLTSAVSSYQGDCACYGETRVRVIRSEGSCGCVPRGTDE